MRSLRIDKSLIAASCGELDPQGLKDTMLWKTMALQSIMGGIGDYKGTKRARCIIGIIG